MSTHYCSAQLAAKTVANYFLLEHWTAPTSINLGEIRELRYSLTVIDFYLKNKRQEIEARLLDRTYEYQREIRDGYLGDNVSGDGAWPDYARLHRRGTAKASNGMAMVRKLSIQSRPLLPEPSLTYHTVINDVIVLSCSSFSQNRPSQHHSAQYPVFTSPYSLSSATPLPSFAITSAQHHSTQDHSSLPIVGLSSLWKVMGRPQVGRDSGKFLIGSVKSTCQSYPLASTASMICIPGTALHRPMPVYSCSSVAI